MLYAVEPTLASELERGTIIRGGCQNLRVTKVTYPTIASMSLAFRSTTTTTSITAG